MDRAELVDTLVEHAQHPQNFGELADADVTQAGGNPGCGDVVTLYLKLDGDRVEKLNFTGQGCTISQAAASILTGQVEGMTLAEIGELDYTMVEEALSEELVRLRPRCATLALDTLKAAARQAAIQSARNSSNLPI